MVLGDVAAFHQHSLRVLHVDPVIGHRPPTERGPQTGDRRAVSKSSLMLDVGHPEHARRLLEEIALLVGVLRAAQESDRIGPVDGDFFVADLLRRDPRFVADLLDPPRDFFGSLLPADVFPVIAAGRTVERLLEPVRGRVRREHGDALHAQRSAADDVVVIASTAINFPSRTWAIMPQPHEQKLQAVVNSLMSASFTPLVAARISGTLTKPPSASPAPVPRLNFRRSLRLTERCGFGP